MPIVLGGPEGNERGSARLLALRVEGEHIVFELARLDTSEDTRARQRHRAAGCARMCTSRRSRRVRGARAAWRSGTGPEQQARERRDDDVKSSHFFRY
jgi:hypothetical protein